MKNKIEDPRAFPLSVNDLGDAGYEGMTLRDYFAAHAPISFADASAFHQGEVSYGQVIRTLAQMRGAYADEMLKAREA